MTSSRTRRSLGWLLDGVLLVGLCAYVLAGVEAVPLHGDESMQISASGDFHTLVVEGHVSAMFWVDGPPDRVAQILRVANGTVGPMVIGLGWHAAGLGVEDLNQPYEWRESYAENRAEGRIPSDALLLASRRAVTILTVLSLLVVFAFARWIGGRPAAWVAAVLYATDPILLLHGRHAMMEGALLLFGGLTLLAARWWIHVARRTETRGWTLLFPVVALGVAGGLALASKHSAALLILAAFLAVWLEPAVRPGLVHRGWAVLARGHVARLASASVLVFLVFLLVTPAWWPDPAGMAKRTGELRQMLVESAVLKHGGRQGVGERGEALLRQTFWAGPMYYENAMWADVLRADIASYEQSIGSGRSGAAWRVLLIAATLAGLLAIGSSRAGTRSHWQSGSVLVLLAWLGGTALGLWFLIPLEWQRYYLPLRQPLAVLQGVGVAWLLGLVFQGLMRSNRRVPSCVPSPYGGA